MTYEWINKNTNQPLNKTKDVDGIVVDLTAEEISKIETEREYIFQSHSFLQILWLFSRNHYLSDLF
mgnify:CR=1 FL=1